MEQLTDEVRLELAQGYLTGFFDAEGYVRIAKDGTLGVGINLTYKPTLELIDKAFKSPSGIKVHSKKTTKYGGNRKDAWKWRQSSDNAILFLKFIFPYSFEKRKQIELAIKYQKEIRTSHKERRSGSMFRLSQLEVEQREWFRKELERLKHEKYDEQTFKDYDNEINKLKIPKDVREGKQLIFSISKDKDFADLDEINRRYNIKETDNRTKVNIPEMPLMPSNIEIGYFSGFFDGEGYIGICKSKRDGYMLTVAINNSNFNILKRYQSKFNGKIRSLNRNYEEHHKHLFQWYLLHREALSFLEYIKDTCTVKSEQAEVAIKFQGWHNNIGIIKSFEQKKIAEKYYQTLKDLKKETGESDLISESDFEEEPEDPFAKY